MQFCNRSYSTKSCFKIAFKFHLNCIHNHQNSSESYLEFFVFNRSSQSMLWNGIEEVIKILIGLINPCYYINASYFLITSLISAIGLYNGTREAFQSPRCLPKKAPPQILKAVPALNEPHSKPRQTLHTAHGVSKRYFDCHIARPFRGHPRRISFKRLAILPRMYRSLGEKQNNRFPRHPFLQN